MTESQPRNYGLDISAPDGYPRDDGAPCRQRRCRHCSVPMLEKHSECGACRAYKSRHGVERPLTREVIRRVIETEAAMRNNPYGYVIESLARRKPRARRKAA